MIIFDASRINTGGGKVLLEYFIERNKKRDNILYLLDNRLDSSFVKNNNCNYLIKGKDNFLFSKIKLILNKKQSRYFSFINIPSILLALFQVEQIVYIHNTYIFKNKSMKFRVLRFLIRLSCFLNKKITFYVQTQTVKNNFLNTFKFMNVKLMPFYDSEKLKKYQKMHSIEKPIYDFIYVGLPSGHKNHEILIDSLKFIPKNIIFKIAMTIPKYEDRLLDKIKDHNLTSHITIINLGLLPYDKAMESLAKSKCLIFPSLLETYGLPLIEAQIVGLDILASKLPYVDDVIDPTDTFNPLDKIDIKDCVIRYILNKNNKKPQLKSINKIKDIENILFEYKGK